MKSENPNKQACDELRNVRHKFNLNVVVMADLKPRRTDAPGEQPIPWLEQLETRLSDWEQGISDGI